MTAWIRSLNALRPFEASARHLSYRCAAEELHVSLTAVKQLVTELEQAVETSLLVSRGRSLARAQAR